MTSQGPARPDSARAWARPDFPLAVGPMMQSVLLGMLLCKWLKRLLPSHEEPIQFLVANLDPGGATMVALVGSVGGLDVSE